MQVPHVFLSAAVLLVAFPGTMAQPIPVENIPNVPLTTYNVGARVEAYKSDGSGWDKATIEKIVRSKSDDDCDRYNGHCIDRYTIKWDNGGTLEMKQATSVRKWQEKMSCGAWPPLSKYGCEATGHGEQLLLGSSTKEQCKQLCETHRAPLCCFWSATAGCFANIGAGVSSESDGNGFAMACIPQAKATCAIANCKAGDKRLNSVATFQCYGGVSSCVTAVGAKSSCCERDIRKDSTCKKDATVVVTDVSKFDLVKYKKAMETAIGADSTKNVTVVIKSIDIALVYDFSDTCMTPQTCLYLYLSMAQTAIASSAGVPKTDVNVTLGRRLGNLQTGVNLRRLAVTKVNAVITTADAAAATKVQGKVTSKAAGGFEATLAVAFKTAGVTVTVTEKVKPKISVKTEVTVRAKAGYVCKAPSAAAINNAAKAQGPTVAVEAVKVTVFGVTTTTKAPIMAPSAVVVSDDSDGFPGWATVFMLLVLGLLMGVAVIVVSVLMSKKKPPAANKPPEEAPAAPAVVEEPKAAPSRLAEGDPEFELVIGRAELGEDIVRMQSKLRETERQEEDMRSRMKLKTEHKFFFIERETFLDLPDDRPIPKHQELLAKCLLVEQEVSIMEILTDTLREATAVVSHRWFDPSHPDPAPDMIKLKQIKKMLRDNPRIQRLWMDYIGLPQGGAPRTLGTAMEGWVRTTNLQLQAVPAGETHARTVMAMQADGYPTVVLKDESGAMLGEVPNCDWVEILAKDSGGSTRVRWETTGRSKEDQAYFEETLACILPNLFLGSTMFVLYETQYAGRFWPKVELFIGMKTPSRTGLAPSSARNDRLIFGAILSCKGQDEDQKAMQIKLLRNRSTKDAVESQFRPLDILVTNQKDKDILLLVLEELDTNIMLAWEWHKVLLEVQRLRECIRSMS